MSPERRQHGINISLSALASGIPVLLAVWFLIKPAVVGAVSEQLKAQVQETVAREVRPINTALAIILQNTIQDLTRQIAAMEFRRDFPPPGDWTNEDGQQLTNMRLSLRSNMEALAALLIADQST